MPRRRDLPGAKPWPFPAEKSPAGGFAERQTRLRPPGYGAPGPRRGVRPPDSELRLTNLHAGLKTLSALRPRYAASYTSGVVPGTAAGSTGFGPNANFAGVRSSLDVFITQSHDIARPV